MSEIIQYDPQEEQLDNFIVPVEPGFYLADNGRVATEFYQAGNEVVFVNKGRRISWTPNDMRYIDEFGMEDTIFTVQEVPLETKGNYARYNRAMPDVDDWFIQENDRLKHQILIQGFQPDPSPWLTGKIDFAVGGKMRFDDDLKIMANGQEQVNPFETHGSIQLYDGDQLIFELPQIIAFDSAYDRQGKSGKYRVWFNDNAEMMFDIIIDYEWISSMKRVYPVVIDPTVIVNSGFTFGSPTGRKGVELSNGWLIVGVYDSTNKRIILLKSADKGATWSQLCFVQNGTTSLFDFALSNLGNMIHLAFNNEESLNQQTKILKIDATTVTNINVYSTSAAVFGGLKAEGFSGVDIFTEPNGTIHISSSFRVGSASYNPYNIYYTSTTDGGVTWSAARYVTNYSDDVYKAYKPRVMTTNGKPFIVFEFVEGGTYYGISVAYYTGTSWVHSQNGIRSSGQAGAVLPCPAVDKTGAVHVVWQENNDYTGKTNILYSKSTDGCATWSAPVDLTPASFRKEAPVITIGKNGYLYVFLRGGNFDGSVGFYQLSRVIHNGTSWAAEETLTSYTSQKNITLTALFEPTLSTSLVGWAWSDGIIVQFEKIVLNQAPNAPILTAKSNFDATAAADFAWVYSDPDPSDTQSAYQLQVKDVATGSIVHDTGKVASTTAKRTIAASTLANGKQYQWRVKTWDSSNTEGAYSDYATFFTSAKPTVSFTNLIEGQTFGGSTITPEWSMSDPESEGQSAYRIELLSSTDELIWDSGKVPDSRGRSRTVAYTLVNNKTYKLRITVWDTKDIPSTSVTRTFNVAYTAPKVPQLVTSTDSIRGSIAVEVINDDNVVEFANPLVANFAGKVVGSTIENPHKASYTYYSTLVSPTSATENPIDHYGYLSKLDGSSSSRARAENGVMAQQIFSFNIIEEIKRKTGITLSVEQAKSIITKLTADWHGWGTNKHATPIGKVDFTGKVGGSTVENPHAAKRFGNQTALASPSAFTVELDSTMYGQISTLNGVISSQTSGTSAVIAQQLFSFNLIEYIQRKYTFTIPGATTADKVAWLKSNIKTLTCNWHGKGSGPSGSKAVTALWSGTAWNYGNVHTSSAISKLTTSVPISTHIMSDGFLHVLAYTDASNGTIASTIETDFVELEVELAGANKANLMERSVTNNNWVFLTSHTNFTVDKISLTADVTMPNGYKHLDLVDANGFVHYLAYADPSNGLAASTIHTDYVQLSIEFDYKKLIATLPKVISNEVYRRVVGELDWKRVGYVQPTLYGENLLPPFTEWLYLHANVKVIAPYELILEASGQYNSSYVDIPITGGSTFTLSAESITLNGRMLYTTYDSSGAIVDVLAVGLTSSVLSKTISTGAKAVKLRITFDNTAIGTFVLTRPAVYLGTSTKPFSPQKYGVIFTDYTPASEKQYEYKAKGIGSNLSSSESSNAAAAVSLKDVILSKASDPNVFVKLKWNPSRNEKRSRERTLSQFAGRQDPVAEFGNARSFNLDASFSILEKTELETLRMLVDSGDILLYRDGRGRREFVSIADLTITDEKPTYYQVSLPMTRVSYEEGV